MWHEIKEINQQDTGSLTASCQLSKNSNWFLGHFPGKPILPGIAQLAMVKEMIERAEYPSENDSENDGIHFSRIKFKKMITPGERLNITVSPKETAGAYSFRISVGNLLASSGNLTITSNR